MNFKRHFSPTLRRVLLIYGSQIVSSGKAFTLRNCLRSRRIICLIYRWETTLRPMYHVAATAVQLFHLSFLQCSSMSTAPHTSSFEALQRFDDDRTESWIVGHMILNIRWAFGIHIEVSERVACRLASHCQRKTNHTKVSIILYFQRFSLLIFSFVAHFMLELK